MVIAAVIDRPKVERSASVLCFIS